MSDLVTLVEAKFHLRIDDTFSDVDLSEKITQASDIVTDYVGTTAADGSTPADWDTDTVPPRAKLATLLVLATIFASREGFDDPLSVGAVCLLARLRPVVFA
ncbi:head-tail connector protein [Paraburkholderia fungorum]|uniref:head-tail connector protein n=1 Tax=Paraburkholderia fungorum TaxID=134537 RepID=UPI0038B72B45